MTLTFVTGLMNSGKTSALLARNFRAAADSTMIVTPRDNSSRKLVDAMGREAAPGLIQSRTGMSTSRVSVLKPSELLKINCSTRLVLVDEAHWLTEPQVYHLAALSNSIDVECYGLRKTHENFLWPASKLLLMLADVVQVLPAPPCERCEQGSRPARHDFKISFPGDDANALYESLCDEHRERMVESSATCRATTDCCTEKQCGTVGSALGS